MKDISKVNTILYVEDDIGVQRTTAEFLKHFCNTLYTADDGKQGLIKYKKYTPDIIITDIRMPIMDGVEMSKQIKHINPNQYIIFTTAHTDIDYFKKAIELQVEGYIIKPVEYELLMTRIDSIVNQIKLKLDLEVKEQMLMQQSKLASMGEMIGNIAHQWKQPLATTKMNLTSLAIDKDTNQLDDEKLEKYINSMEEQIDYLSNTIDDFKNFFKPINNTVEFSVREFLEKCITLVEASFKKNYIDTIQDIDENINAYGNPNYLIQAIVNILNNAKDALLDAKDIQEKLVFIILVKSYENRFIIEIKDNAGGIPESYIDKIFDPYFTTKKEETGTGLGLYIAKTIIEKHLHGSIKVENNTFIHDNIEYKGACFEIDLPTYHK